MDFSEFSKCTNMKQVAEDYGFEISKAGNICCPFHNEKTPSMKLYDDHYHCFGCGAHGDVIDFVAKLTDTSPMEAAKEIRDRYCLNISDDNQSRPSVLSKLEKAKHEKEVEFFTRVLIKYCKLEEMKLETDHNLPVPEIVKARTNIEYVDYILEELLHTDREKRYGFIQNFKDTLKFCESEIIKDNIKITKENIAI